MKQLTIEELLNMPRKQFIDRNKEWMKEFNDGEYLDVEPLECPLHLWVVHNKAKCIRETVPLTMNCPLCGNPCCPECMNHKVEQLSRVTGYLSTVGNWGAAKKQEFIDRQRYNV